MTKTQQQNLRRWSQTLRSNTYQQGHGMLKLVNPDATASYCCLGVLASTEFPQHFDESSGKFACPLPNSRTVFSGYGFLPEFVFTAYTGLPINIMDRLMQMNDRGFTFDEIADILDILSIDPTALDGVQSNDLT